MVTCSVPSSLPTLKAGLDLLFTKDLMGRVVQFVLAFLGKTCCALGHFPALHQELLRDVAQCLDPPVSDSAQDCSTDITVSLKWCGSEVIFR